MANHATGYLVTAADYDAETFSAGDVKVTAGTAVPTGWLACDGTAVSRTTYATLYGVIGTLYGSGDGSTTFNVPDTRGRVFAGFAASGGHTDVSTIGNNDGVAAANRRPKHRHTAHTHASGNGNILTDGAGTGSGATGSGGSATHFADASGGASVTSVDGGSGTSTDSLDAPAYIVFNMLIKT
jgi:microcystin-dependent protein